jgi:hypothetical protein
VSARARTASATIERATSDGHAGARSFVYSVHPSVAMWRTMLDNLQQRTGRSADEWAELARAEGPPTESGRRAWLKSAHGLGSNLAYLVAARAEGREGDAGDADAYLAEAARYVESMYAGPKAALRPIHDAVLAAAIALGPDVRVSPCKTIVPVFRAHVFAQLKPSTRTRLDLGLALGDAPAEGRLVQTRGLEKGDRITHRIGLGSAAEVDGEVRAWLRAAYERDA